MTCSELYCLVHHLLNITCIYITSILLSLSLSHTHTGTRGWELVQVKTRAKQYKWQNDKQAERTCLCRESRSPWWSKSDLVVTDLSTAVCQPEWGAPSVTGLRRSPAWTACRTSAAGHLEQQQPEWVACVTQQQQSQSESHTRDTIPTQSEWVTHTWHKSNTVRVSHTHMTQSQKQHIQSESHTHDNNQHSQSESHTHDTIATQPEWITHTHDNTTTEWVTHTWQ